MRFELSVALKYLLPRSRQLSASIISLISVGVISLVVWLVIVFMSVTEGLEKKWIEELVALNAPLRLTPTEAYYHSYYYQVDGLSSASNYTFKSIGEKLSSQQSDPYDPLVDGEIPSAFPNPVKNEEGEVKDLVKEAYTILEGSPFSIRPQEYEISFGNMRLSLLRDSITLGEKEESFMTQVTYVAPYDPLNVKFQSLIAPIEMGDINNMLLSLASMEVDSENEKNESTLLEEKLTLFFDNISITGLKTVGSLCPPSLFPQEGYWKGCAVLSSGKVSRIYIPEEEEHIEALAKGLLEKVKGDVYTGHLHFDHGKLSFFRNEEESVCALPLATTPKVIFSGGVPFASHIKRESLIGIEDLSQLRFHVEGVVQGIPVAGELPFAHLEVTEAHPIAEGNSPFWLASSSKETLLQFPAASFLGEGVVLPKHYRENGVYLGDRGTMTFYSSGGLSPKEQQVAIYVAGFYDPGLMPVGNKLVFASPALTEILKGGMKTSDQMLGNGISLWIDHIGDAQEIKLALQKAFDEKLLSPYWKIESYSDFEFVQPIVQQLKSDKTLFTLIAFIILLVACSNVISMLILLVNDKKKEIGILQAMGVSATRIGVIFGLCGFLTGLVSSILGTLAAIFTLIKLQSLVDLLSFIQGREAFQTAFYGSGGLPNTLSIEVLVIVSCATVILSLIAGVIPAIKAARVKPAEILRSE